MIWKHKLFKFYYCNCFLFSSNIYLHKQWSNDNIEALPYSHYDPEHKHHSSQGTLCLAKHAYKHACVNTHGIFRPTFNRKTCCFLSCLFVELKGVLHLLSKIIKFCALFQNNQYPSWKITNAYIVNYSRNSKWHWNFSRPNSFWAMDQTFKMLFESVTQEPLGLPKFWYSFWIPWTIYYKIHIFSKIYWWFWGWAQNMLIWGEGKVHYPLNTPIFKRVH